MGSDSFFSSNKDTTDDWPSGGLFLVLQLKLLTLR